MDYLWAVVLGIVQGLTEFLPVSSSGHLAVMQEVLGLEGPRLLMTVALHAGTLGSVLALYGGDVLEIVRGSMGCALPGRMGRGPGGTRSEADRSALAMAIAVAACTLVTGPIALALRPLVEPLGEDLGSLGGLFAITGLLLLGTRFTRSGDRDVGPLAALMVGLAQGLAVFPGISRSGATIVAALLVGVRRDEAVRFSFLAGLPVISGALVLEGGLDAADVAARWPVYLAGAVAAFLSGWAAIGLLRRIAATRRLHLFALYLLPLGLALFLVSRVSS